MATILRTVKDTDDPAEQERRGKDWLQASADDKVVACRGQGHAFPKIRSGRGNRRGIRAIPVYDGCFQVEFTCRDCGTVRWLVTLPGGEFDLPAKYTYKWPGGYKAPKGSGLTRRDFMAEAWRREREDLLAAATSAGPPPVLFSEPEQEARR